VVKTLRKLSTTPGFMRDRPSLLVEHFHRLRLVAGTGGKELVELRLRLSLGFSVVGASQRRGSALCREQ
jgi:hypothetical protein